MNRLGSAALAFTAIALPIMACAKASPRDPATEDANRALVVNFYDQFFNAHETEAASRVIAKHYIQHNPSVPDGKAPLVTFFTGFFAENPDSRTEIIRSAADGDLVWLHVHSTNGKGDKGTAMLDVFRADKGIIVAHRDVTQPVPEDAANDNTMFQFPYI